MSVETNGTGQRIFRCKHRGTGCAVPGRGSKGLHAAARLALNVLKTDEQLQTAIRQHLAEGSGARAAQPSRSGAVAKLRQKRQKLLELHFAEQITPDFFAEQESLLSAQIKALEAEAQRHVAELEERSLLADRFEQVAAQLRDLDADAIWQAATDDERRTLIDQIIGAIIVHPDRLQVSINGAPPLTVNLDEVGLRKAQQPPREAAGTGIVVSEGGLEPPRTYVH